jgi:hypothetical protein
VSQSLIAEIRQLLGQVLVPSVTAQAAADDIFEVYVFGLVLEAARREGAVVIEYENVTGGFSGVCTFRTSSGRIWSQARPYTHAIVRFSNKPPLEVHLGIMMQGSSGVLHEADVVVIPRSEGAACRSSNVEPRASAALLTAECKFYTTPLPLGMGRSFIGLSSEFGKKKAFFAMNQPPGTVGVLLKKHVEHWEPSIVPVSVSDVGRFIGNLQTPFKNFKTG